MKKVKIKKHQQEKLGIKPDHKTNEDFNQQEPRLAKPTIKEDKQEPPAYNKKETTQAHNPENKANAQVLVDDKNNGKEAEKSAARTDAERAEKEARNQSEQKETD